MNSPIKELLISAILYLPLCFFLWFYGASLLILPAHGLAEWMLTWWQSDLFNGITQTGYMFNVETLIMPQQLTLESNNQLAILDVSVNPMKYGYGLAVLAGLVISVPALSWKSKLWQLLAGFLMVSVIQANGVFWEACKSLLFSGGDAFAAINATGISHDLVVVMYQLSYLILPAVLPVVMWVLMNRRFIESITGLDTIKE